MNTAGKLISLVDSPRIATFTKWEQDFIASLDNQIESGGTISPKQKEMVEKIHDKYFG